MSSKAHKPTDEQRSEVRALASFGVMQEDIAAYIGISHPTLRKYYREELDFSAIKANATVGKYLFRLASGQALRDPQTPATHSECARAAMFWAKTRMGWRETDRMEVTGEGGGAVPVEMTVGDDLRQALDAIARKIAAGGTAHKMACDSEADANHA